MKQNIEIHIEELVLHSLPPGNRYRIGKALELELTRLFRERSIPPSLSRNGEYAQLNGGTFNLLSGSKAEVIGAQVAKSIYSGLIK